MILWRHSIYIKVYRVNGFILLNETFFFQVNLQNTVFGKSNTEKAMSVGEITNELKIMKEEMRHPNIVRYYKTFELGEEKYLCVGCDI